MEITLNVNEKQLNVIKEALDIYARFGMGQLDRLQDHPSFNKLNIIDILERTYQLRNLAFPDLYGIGESYGIRSEKVPEECKIAMDIFQVIRHGIYDVNKYANNFTVDSNIPFQFSNEELPKFKIETKGE